MVLGWLVSSLMPAIPHAIMLLSGEQGVGKSCAGRVLVSLIDPSPAPLRSEPKDPESWAIAAAGSWVVAVDNISYIPSWFSDCLCRASTGDGWIRRKLYSDSELSVLSFKRAVILTSIDPGALRGDLGDRLLLVDLERILDESRKTESDLASDWKELQPRLLGALLSATARTLAELPSVKLDSSPRMADFARVLAALDKACPELTGGRALELFAGQRKRISIDVVEADPVGAAILQLVKSQKNWSGTAQALLSQLTPDRPPKGWPQTAEALGRRLSRIIPALRQVGLSVEYVRKKDRRTLVIGKATRTVRGNTVTAVTTVTDVGDEGLADDDSITGAVTYCHPKDDF